MAVIGLNLYNEKCGCVNVNVCECVCMYVCEGGGGGEEDLMCRVEGYMCPSRTCSYM